MGIEPTNRTVYVRLSGFEDRGHHQVYKHFPPVNRSKPQRPDVDSAQTACFHENSPNTKTRLDVTKRLQLSSLTTK